MKFRTLILFSVVSVVCACSKDNLGGTEYSEKDSEINIIIQNRAALFRDVQWTAISPLASTTDTHGITQGNHTGVPYTSCNEVEKIVGFNVSLRTFLSASKNPYSLLYTEDLNRNISGYGFDYVGGRSTIGGWMGMVCSSYVSFVLGLEYPYNTSNWAYLCETGKMTEIADVEDVKVGDVLWQKGHVRVITNVGHESSGKIYGIEVSESVQDFPRKTTFTVNGLRSNVASTKGKIYRYNNLEYSVNQSQTEDITGITYNNDICSYAGDYACFRQGEKVVINYGLQEGRQWNEMELFRDEALVQHLAIDSQNHSIDITDFCKEYGMYKARLVSVGGSSEFTYFEVLETEVNATGTDGEHLQVTFSSHNALPVYLKLENPTGGQKANYILSAEEIGSGSCTLNIPKLFEEQHNTSSGKTYLKVFFNGKYGTIANKRIEVNLQ